MARTATKKSGADAPKTVKVGGRALRARTPDEWSIEDNELVLRHSLGISQQLTALDGLSKAERTAAFLGIATDLLNKGGGAFKDMLVCGLWPDGVPYSIEAAAEHEEYVHSTFLMGTEAVEALALAVQSFTQS